MFFEVLKPFWQGTDSETAHIAAREALRFAGSIEIGRAALELANYKGSRFEDPRLHTTLGALELENPVLVAAGWDKPGVTVPAWYALGCAGVEVGTVTEFPQEGNPKPRQFYARRNDGVILNRLGFNGPGMEVVADNLSHTLCYPGAERACVGVSVGRNRVVPDKDAPAAHAAVVGRLYPRANYIAVNVSSPNSTGLRGLQAKGPLTDILQAVNQTMEAQGGRKPLFVKIAPDDMTNGALDDVIRVVQDEGATGIIAANTTVAEELKAEYGWRGQKGGLSGDDREYRRRTTALIKSIYMRTSGTMPIIGVGGINSAETALEKVLAGASGVQIMSGIRQVGPTLPGRINRGIVDYMQRNRFASMEEVIGLDYRRGQTRRHVRVMRG